MSLPFKEYINKEMTPYKIVLPLLFSFFIAIIATVSMVYHHKDSNHRFVLAITPHVSSLLESRDTPELNRFLFSVAQKEDAIFEVVQYGKVVISTLSPTRVGSDTQLEHYLKTSTNITRSGGPQNLDAKIIQYSSLKNLIISVLGISALSFFGALLFLTFVLEVFSRVTQRFLSPLAKLDNAIALLGTNANLLVDSKFDVTELENIRQTLVNVTNDLNESNLKLAKAKGRELASEAYLRLIHDLNVPMTGLSNHLKILSLDNIGQDTKEMSRQKIAELGDQIFRQIKMARSQLDIEITIKSNENICESVSKATATAKSAIIDRTNLKILGPKTCEQIMYPHDPIMLGRAVTNLVANAIESCKGKVEVNVTRDNNLKILIADDGPGIKEEDVSLFLQGRGKSTKANRAAIGLSSANHIVRMHGGKIIYRQSHLGGACFEIQL